MKKPTSHKNEKIGMHKFPTNKVITRMRDDMLSRRSTNMETINNYIKNYLKEKFSRVQQKEIDLIGIDSILLKELDTLEKIKKSELLNYVEMNNRKGIIKAGADLIQIHLILDIKNIQNLFLVELKKELKEAKDELKK